MSNEDPNGPFDNGGSAAPKLQAQATHDLGEVTDTAMRDLDAITQRAKDDVRDLGHQAGEKVAEVTDKAKSFAADQTDKAKSFATDQKALAAGQISGVANAITRVAEELEGSDQQTVARYARDLASGLSSMGKTIEDRDVDDLMGMAQDFGRKQPVAFLGAAALAGFVASRFALASSHRRENKSAASTSYQPDTASSYQPDTGSSYQPDTTPSASSYQPDTTPSSYGAAASTPNRTGEF